MSLVAAALTRCGVSPPVQLPDSGPRTATIYFVERGWHTDIGLPADELKGKLASLVQRFPGVRFLIIGFGERNYLLSRSHNLADEVSALFPSPAAMLVTGLSAPPQDAFSDQTVIRLRVTQAGFDRLIGFVADSFADMRQPIADGPYPGSLFYAASGSYDLAHTCNAWTAEGLQVAGLAVSPAGVVFASQVVSQAKHAAVTGN